MYDTILCNPKEKEQEKKKKKKKPVNPDTYLQIIIIRKAEF